MQRWLKDEWWMYFSNYPIENLSDRSTTKLYYTLPSWAHNTCQNINLKPLPPLKTHTSVKWSGLTCFLPWKKILDLLVFYSAKESPEFFFLSRNSSQLISISFRWRFLAWCDVRRVAPNQITHAEGGRRGGAAARSREGRLQSDILQSLEKRGEKREVQFCDEI